MASICTPAIVYLVLSIIAIIAMVSVKFQPISILIKIFFIALWTWFLNFLCSSGYEWISWFLVILPFIIFLIMIALSYEVFLKLKNNRIHS
jgi:ABC-type uncharacterized transport system permease subunit